jgi:hypothetical protein
MRKLERPRGKASATWTGVVVGGVALVVSVFSLVLDVHQGDALEEQRRVTGMPILMLDTILAPTEGYEGIGVYLRNEGNGVARILTGAASYGSVSLEDDNGPFAGMANVIRAGSGSLFTHIHYAGPVLGWALQAGGRQLLLGIDVSDYTPERGAALEPFIRGMMIRFEYKSLYDGDQAQTVVLSPAAT